MTLKSNMELRFSQEELRELNSIKSMLVSPDEEAVYLGFELLKTSETIKKKVSGLYYLTKSQKLVPVSWFIQKAEQLKNDPQYGASSMYLRHLLLPILHDITSGDSTQFRAFVSFKFDQ
ncbi:MAG: hypothetical protein Q4C49_01070 [Bacillota bacterium]|nr:hypothetical protein [Bacillota bacterium]